MYKLGILAKNNKGGSILATRAVQGALSNYRDPELPQIS